MAKRAERRLPVGWVLATVLLGLYLILKIQAWWYEAMASSLERRLSDLRPVLSAIILQGRLEDTLKASHQAFDQIRRLDLEGGRFLQELSKEVPASVTLSHLEINPRLGARLQGAVLPGIRPPEEVLLSWIQRWQGTRRYNVQVRELNPDRQDASLWHFELNLKLVEED